MAETKATEADGKVLTKAIAEQLLDRKDSVDLSEFTAIEDEAAKILLEYEGKLSLDGLSHVEALFSKLSGLSASDDDAVEARHCDESDAERAVGNEENQHAVRGVINERNAEEILGEFLYRQVKEMDDDALQMTVRKHLENEYSGISFRSLEDEIVEYYGEEFFYDRGLGDPPRPECPDATGTLTNSIGLKLVPIKAGTFMMGSP